MTWSAPRWLGRWLRSPGCSPWAAAPRSTPAKRVGFDTSRPLLAVNPRSSWVRLMADRRPIYERVSAHRVDTAGRAPEDVAAEVAALLGEQ